MSRLALMLTVPLLLTFGSTPAPQIHGSPEPPARPEAGTGAADVLADLPLTFVETPDAPDGIAYRTSWGAASVGFGPGGLDLALADTAGTTQRWGLRLDFTDARPAEPAASARAPGVVSYFRGSPDEWEVGLSTYSRLAYRNLWPGIDLGFSGGPGSLKYSFHVAAGADPEAIGLDWRRATATPSEDGGLRIATPAGTLLDGAPIAWQPGPSGRAAVDASWEERADGSWGFRLGSYDPARALVIDPEVVFTRFIGGSGGESGEDIAVDGSGSTYITGNTAPVSGGTSDFPATVGPDTSFAGEADAFVAKLTPGGAGVAYAGFIGGSGFENGSGIAVDAAGAAYVAGTTSSSTAEGFPTTVGPDLSLGGPQDAFVAKVSPDGTGLAYAGYIGGISGDNGADVAVDGSGAAYVTGTTSSDATTFPDLVGPDLTYAGGNDGFIAKVMPNGAAFAYAGYVGGTNFEVGQAVAVDGSGAAYLTGQIHSTEATFPVAVGPDTTHNGNADAYIVKVKANGTGFDYAGYVGGTDGDAGIGVAVDGSGAAYIGGVASSDQAVEGFPVVVGPDTAYAGSPGVPGGPPDGFIAKVDPSGAGLVYAGYVGGNDMDTVSGVAVDGAGGALVAGETGSTETDDGFPALGGPDGTFNGGTDGFVGRILPSGTGLGFLGYLGGLKFDDAEGVAVDGAGVAYVVGHTNSNQATFPSISGFSGTNRDVFVVAVAEMCRGRLATVVGTEGKDTLAGTNGADVIAAGGGSDRVNGKGGKDRICGEGGNDKLKGGGGNDKLYGDEGKDSLDGQAGRDTCVGGPKKDRADCERERQI